MIQILCASIAQISDEDYRKLYSRASVQRQQRADRYRRREDSLRCILSDALLRHALGTDRYTVETGEFGKPCVRDVPEFYYNLSHSGDWVVLAHGGTEVGVDVQKMEWDPGKEHLARRCFTAEEQRYVFEREDGVPARFYEIWTKKESYLKYLGTGIRSSLDMFSVLSGIQPRLFTRLLGEEYCLSLCTGEGEYEIVLLDAAQL